MTLRERLTQLPRDTRDTLFLLLVVAWIVMPQVDRLPWWATALASVLLAWRAWLAWGSRPLPRRWVLVLALAAAVSGTLITHRTLVGQEAGVTLVVMLLCLKTLELRARRDAMVIFFLGFFTMLSNFFFSQSLLTAAAMLVALLGLLTALVNAHMPVGRPPLMQSMRTAGQMALLGAPVMAALFVLFPRVAPLWGVPSQNPGASTGLSDVMKVGQMASLALNDGVALRVLFDTPDHEPPPAQAMYFRGPVFGHFDGKEWTPGIVAPEPAANAPAGYGGLPAALRVKGPAIRYQVTLEPHRNPWLLTLEAAPEKPTLPEGMNAFMTQDLQWLANRPIGDVMRYTAQSHIQFQHGPLRSTPALRQFVQMPADSNPRTRALAQQMLAEAAAPADTRQGTTALIQQTLQRLRTGGYTYTLEPGVYGQHTADEFWFDRKEGFCEHIASSFVILMRAMNIPARIVTGYQGGDRNPLDGYWTVRQSDAHAWAEVWVPEQGWTRVDPTGAVAPGRVGAFNRLQARPGVLAAAMGTVIGAGLLENARAVWEAVNNRWNQWVLNYTQSQQMDLLKSLGFESPSWQDLSTVLVIVIAIVASAAIGWSLWERRQHDPWLRLLGRARERLARAGLALPAQLPPRAMAQQVRAQWGPAAEPIAAWLLRLEQLRYAPEPRSTLNTLQTEFRSLPWPRPVAPQAATST